MPNWLKKTLQLSGLIGGVCTAAAVVLSTGPISLPLVLKAVAAAMGALTAGGAGWTSQPPGQTNDGGTPKP